MSIGESILNARKSRHMTRVELAKQLSITVPFLKKIECDIILPSKMLINKIANVLQVVPTVFGLDEVLIQMSQGERLQYYRKCAGITQTEFAKKLGYRVNYISYLEQDKRIIPLPILARSSVILNVKFTDLCPDINYGSMSNGEKIRFFRKIQNFTIEEIGEKTRISPRRLEKIEKDLVEPSAIEMKYIAESLNLNISAFDITSDPTAIQKGGIIRFYRNAAHITKSELSQQLGISDKDLSDIENNKRKPNKKLLRKIAKICDFDISVFGFDNMSRGEKIKYFREKAGLSQEKLASQIVDLSKSELARIEENRKKISDQMYLQISKILQFTDSYFENESIGDIIKSNRIKAGLTQRELCNKAGVSSSTLSRIEKNNGNYRNKSLFRIVRALNLDPCLFDSLIVQDTTNLSRGQIIKSYRQANGLSRKDLANMIGKSLTYIKYLEDGEREAYDSTLIRISEIFEFDATILDLHNPSFYYHATENQTNIELIKNEKIS